MTQLDQVMADLTRRVDGLVAETRSCRDGFLATAADLERRKLNVADVDASLAPLGQRYTGDSGANSPPAGRCPRKRTPPVPVA